MSLPLPEVGTPALGPARAVVCDVDGVVHRGSEVMPTVVETMADLGRRGVRVVYATNNASRPPQTLRDRLRHDGLTVDTDQVVTSSMAGAVVVAERVPAGARVLCIGGEGVACAVAGADLVPVRPGDDLAGVAAVLQGYGSAVTASDLAEGGYAIQAGALWVATNEDLTLPTERGLAPGNGSLVRALRGAVDVDPVVAGKPHAPLYVLASHHAGTEPGEALAVGDRLDTDIAGAVATSMPSAMVLTGVSSLEDALRADASMRPTVVVRHVADLLEPWGTSPRGEQLAEANAVIRRAWAELDALPTSAGRAGAGDVVAAALGRAQPLLTPGERG